MTHRISSLLLLATFALTLSAVPALRTTVTLTRADGTTVTAVLMGDEHFHYFEVPETGERLTVDNDGICHTLNTTEFNSRTRRAQRRVLSARKTTESALYPTTDGTPYDLTGEKHVLVLLVGFNDVPFFSTNEDFQRQLNEVGYSENGHHGSAHDYFVDQSYGQFSPIFDVVGPMQLSRSLAFYGANDSYGNEKHLGTLVSEACSLAHDEHGVDFSDYDWDGDGEAEMVVCVYAGYSEAQTSRNNDIWPLQWWLESAKEEMDDGPGRMEIDGTYINKFLVINELYGRSGQNREGIGTFCHEYAHCLDLPDFYSTNGGNVFGMGDWSLLHSGNYLGGAPFSTPCAFTAYERMFCGWLTPTVLSEDCNIKGMVPLTDAPECYIIYNDAHPDEYYLLQNVQQKDWNALSPGHGLLIQHIDFETKAWFENTVNNDYYHPRCTIIHADNNNYISSRGMAGDPFPGSTNNTSLTDTTTPSANLYNENTDGRKKMGKSITKISEMLENISFSFTNLLSSAASVPAISTPEDTHAPSYDLWGRRITGHPTGLRITDGKVKM